MSQSELYIEYVNIGTSVFAFLIILIKIIGDIQAKKYLNQQRRYFSYMLVVEEMMLATNMMSILMTLKVENLTLRGILVRYFTCIYFISYFMLLGFFSMYVGNFISENSGLKVNLVMPGIIMAMVSSIVWCLGISSGLILRYDGYRLVDGTLYLLAQIAGYGLVAFPYVFIIKYRKYLGMYRVVLLFSFIAFPLIGSFIRLRWREMDYIPFMICLSLNLMDNTLQYDRERLILQQQDKIAQDRIALLLSQIRPHFLYNVLNSIYVLCEKDPERAQEAIGEFSDYLRSNLDSLGQNECIPLAKEMQTVQTYLSLEKMRFGDKLNIKYSIKNDNFAVPALSVQTLAENAVKHGIHKRENGGTLWIYTCEDDLNFYINVEDDGVGFNEKEGPDSEGSHIGLDNLRERLRAMCGGSLEIDSRINEGTNARIIIPKNV